MRGGSSRCHATTTGASGREAGTTTKGTPFASRPGDGELDLVHAASLAAAPDAQPRRRRGCTQRVRRRADRRVEEVDDARLEVVVHHRDGVLPAPGRRRTSCTTPALRSLATNSFDWAIGILASSLECVTKKGGSVLSTWKTGGGLPLRRGSRPRSCSAGRRADRARSPKVHVRGAGEVGRARHLDDGGDARAGRQAPAPGRAEQRHEVAAGGAAERADAVRVDLEARDLGAGLRSHSTAACTSSKPAGNGGLRGDAVVEVERHVARRRRATGRSRDSRGRPCRRGPSCRRAPPRSRGGG